MTAALAPVDQLDWWLLPARQIPPPPIEDLTTWTSYEPLIFGCTLGGAVQPQCTCQHWVNIGVVHHEWIEQHAGWDIPGLEPTVFSVWAWTTTLCNLAHDTPQWGFFADGGAATVWRSVVTEDVYLVWLPVAEERPLMAYTDGYGTAMREWCARR